MNGYTPERISTYAIEHAMQMLRASTTRSA
jgi:hypothetical protein